MDKGFKWRIQAAAILTSAGALYYLVFLFFLSGGVPIERIHYVMTGNWPDVLADSVPLVAPVFLILGLSSWYYYYLKTKPKPVPEPEYKFEFNMVKKTTETEKTAETE